MGIDSFVQILSYSEINTKEPWFKDDRQKYQIVEHNSIGQVIKINDEIFILTCFHCICNATEIICNKFFETKKECSKDTIKLLIVSSSDELDLALLKTVDNYDFGPMDASIFNYKMNDYNCLKFTYRKIKETKKKCVITKKTYSSDRCNVMLKKITSYQIPKLPYIDIYSKKLLNDEKNLNKLAGISGTFAYNKNNEICGIISSCYNKTLVCLIPSIVIKRFLDESISKDNFNGLCGFPLSTISCKITRDDGNVVHGLLVKNNYKIKYDSKQKDNNIQKGDIIHNLNNMELNINATIYDNFTDFSYPFDTYIALHYISDLNINIKVFRDDDTFTISNTCIPFSKNRIIPISLNESKFIIYNGLVFTELTEELIKLYEKRNMFLKGTALDVFTKKKYSNKRKRLIVLVNLLKKQITSKELEEYKKIGILNYINSLIVLTRINRSNLTDLDHMNIILKKNIENKQFYFSVDENNKFIIKYINDKFNEIKI